MRITEFYELFTTQDRDILKESHFEEINSQLHMSKDQQCFDIII